MSATLLIMLALAALEGRPTQAPPPAARLHVYTAASQSYETNAFWLESPTALVVIDTLMLRSDAALLAAAMKATGKPLAGILLTHPHLDHVGGIRTMLKAFGDDVPVIATRATSAGLQPTFAKAMAQGWPQEYGNDFDRVPFVPTRLVDSGTTVTLGGLTFEIRDYGPLEADNNSVIHNHDLNVLFTGDLTVSHAAIYVGEGRSRRLLETLPRVLADFPKVRRVWSGHYGPANITTLITQNLDEIRYYRGVVAAQLADPANVTDKGALTERARARAVDAIAARLGQGATYGMDPRGLAQMNLAGLEPELIAERRTTPPSEAARTLHDGLRRLDFLVGHWTGHVSLPSDAAPQPATTADIRFNVGAGGAYLEGATRVGAFGYRFVLSYDQFQKQYRLSSVDDVSGLLDIYTGQFDATGALVMDNVRSGTFYRAGTATVHNRLTLRPTSGSLWSWRVEASTDAGATWALVQMFSAAERRR